MFKIIHKISHFLLLNKISWSYRKVGDKFYLGKTCMTCSDMEEVEITEEEYLQCVAWDELEIELYGPGGARRS